MANWNDDTAQEAQPARVANSQPDALGCIITLIVVGLVFALLFMAV